MGSHSLVRHPPATISFAHHTYTTTIVAAPPHIYYYHLHLNCNSPPPPPPLLQGTTMSTHYDMLMKLVIVGDSGTGKSCVISRYCDDEFTHMGMSTIGVDFRIQLL